MKKAKLFNWSLPTFLFFISSIWYWIIMPVRVFIITSIVLFISAIITYKFSFFKLFYKETIFKTFLFGLLSNIICVIILFFFELTHIYPPFLYAVNPAIIALIISLVFSVLLHYFFSFETLGLQRISKFIISFFLGVANLPFLFLIPSEIVSPINSTGITKFIDLFNNIQQMIH